MKIMDMLQSGSCEDMEYDGNMRDLADRISEAISENDYYGLFLDSARILRGAVDFSLENNEELYLKEVALRVIKEIYADEFSGLDDMLSRLKIDYSVKEQIDEVTWDSYGNTVKLIDKVPSGFDYIVLIGHGSYRSGFFVAEECGIEPYPIRLSMNKKNDSVPRFGENESLEFMQDKNILIYDEDVVLEETIETMYKYLFDNVSKHLAWCTSDWLGRSEFSDNDYYS